MPKTAETEPLTIRVTREQLDRLDVIVTKAPALTRSSAVRAAIDIGLIELAKKPERAFGTPALRPGKRRVV